MEDQSLASGYNFDKHWWQDENLVVAQNQVPVYRCGSTPDPKPLLQPPPGSSRDSDSAAPALSLAIPLGTSDYEVMTGVKKSVFDLDEKAFDGGGQPVPWLG